MLRQYQKALPQCPLLPQYCSNTLQWALPQCCCNTAIAAALLQYCCNTSLPQYCRNGAIAAIRCAHCSNPQCLNALPQHCSNDLLPQYCSNAFRHCRLPESIRAVCSFCHAALEPYACPLQNQVVVRVLSNQGHLLPPKRQEERTATSRRDGGRTRTAGSKPAIYSATNSSGRNCLTQVADAW